MRGLAGKRPDLASHKCVAVSPSQTRPTSCTEDWAFATAKFTPPCDLKVAIPPLFCFRSSSLGFLNGLFRFAHNPKNLTRADCYAPPVFHTWGTRVGLRLHSWFCFAKLLRSVGRGGSQTCPQFHSVIIGAGICL